MEETAKRGIIAAAIIFVPFITSGSCVTLRSSRIPQHKALEGIVKSEFGNGVSKPVTNKGIFWDNMVMSKPQYGLVVKSQGKTYTIEIIETDYRKPISDLAKAIEPGDKVRVASGNLDFCGAGSLYDDSSHDTKYDPNFLYAECINLVEKAKK